MVLANLDTRFNNTFTSEVAKENILLENYTRINKRDDINTSVKKVSIIIKD